MHCINLAFLIEYKGVFFRGWQFQPNLKTVQGTIFEALQLLFNNRLTYGDLSFTGAGRTDALVNATGQVANLKLSSRLLWSTFIQSRINYLDFYNYLNLYNNFLEDFYSTKLDFKYNWKHFNNTCIENIIGNLCFRLQRGINHFLKNSGVIVLKIVMVRENFNARFNANVRKYVYKINNRDTPGAIFKDLMWHLPGKFNLNLLNHAANSLVGYRDFSSFRGAGCQGGTALRHLYRCEFAKDSYNFLNFFMEAPAFLYNQVRKTLGTLILLATGKIDLDRFNFIVNSCNPTLCGPIAPAHGLYLTHINYGDKLFDDV